MNNKPSYERYNRQIQLKEFGETGQRKLSQAKVVVIGAGGLGCPALQYLTAAGVGTIGIVDDDIIALTNLHRQPLYATEDIGYHKAEIAADRLRRLNPEISIVVYNERLTVANALKIIGAFDIVIDGSDNFATRYLVNDACVLSNKPFVYGAVSQFEGQVSVFNFKSSEGVVSVNYRDIFPIPPKENEVMNCAEGGVLGILPGIIGTMQANEVIKLITGIGKPLINSLLTYNALDNQSMEIALIANAAGQALIPASIEAFESMNYELLCGAETSPLEIDANEFDQYINEGTAMIIDVREVGELPGVTEFSHEHVPLAQLKQRSLKPDHDTVILFCQSGQRSLEAAKYLLSVSAIQGKYLA
jgi:adenylyltransferase/sulfurtransferase